MVLTGHRLRVTAIDFSLSLLFSPFWCLLPKGKKIREMRGVKFFFDVMEDLEDLLQHVVYPFES